MLTIIILTCCITGLILGQRINKHLTEGMGMATIILPASKPLTAAEIYFLDENLRTLLDAGLISAIEYTTISGRLVDRLEHISKQQEG